MWVAIWTVAGAIGLWFALAWLGGWIGGDAAEAGFYLGALIGLPAFLLWLPVLILAVVVDYAGCRAYPVAPIVASWNVQRDGEVHVVSLPDPVYLPDHVWVDGALIPLAWTPTGEWSARAALDCGSFKGTLNRGTPAVWLALSVLGVFPPHRYSLQVKGATVEEVQILDGERRIDAGRGGWRVLGRVPIGGRRRVREPDDRRTPLPDLAPGVGTAPPSHGLAVRRARPTLRSQGRAGRRR